MEIRVKTNPGGAFGEFLASSATGKKSSRRSFVKIRKILKNLTLALIDLVEFSKDLRKSLLARFDLIKFMKILK